jgi:hypothetical protein
VRALETDAVVDPARFRNKVVAVAAIPFIVLGSTLFCLLLLAGFGIAWAGFGRGGFGFALALLGTLALAPLCAVVVRMCLIQVPPPRGRALKRSEAERLYSGLVNIRHQLDGPVLDHVLLDERFHAGIEQRARWGLFGKPVTYLSLGLPYMQSMTPKELLATVAHEMELVCGHRDRLSTWVYRQRRAVSAIVEQIRASQRSNIVDALAMKVLNRFLPYYNAHTIVLSRNDEFEADRSASGIVGAKSNASCLIRGALLRHWIDEEFWPNLQRQANSQERPLYLPYTAMRAAFKASHAQWATADKLAAVWGTRPGLSDTHLPLSARVEALGETAALPPCIKISAAETLLGDRAKALIDEFDQRWWKHEQRRWLARHRYVSGARSRLEQLQRVVPGQLKIEELQELAMLFAEFETPDAARRLHEYLLDLPGGPFLRAEYDYGRLLLADQNQNGLTHLATAAVGDPELTDMAARAGYNFLARTRDEHEAREWWGSVNNTPYTADH